MKFKSSKINFLAFRFGENLKPDLRPPPFGESLWQALDDKIMLLLALFAIITIVTGMLADSKTGWQEGAFILASILTIVTITAINDWNKDKRYV